MNVKFISETHFGLTFGYGVTEQKWVILKASCIIYYNVVYYLYSSILHMLMVYLLM